MLKILSIITVFQLLMLGIVLVSRSNIQKSDYRLLSLFMFSNALVMIQFIINIYELVNIPDISIFYYLLAPLLYLYVQSLCKKNFKLSIKHIIHFLIFFILNIYFLIRIIFLKNFSWENQEFIITQLILHAQIASYIVASFKLIFKYRKEIKNLFTTVDQINLNWLLVILIAFSSMWFIDFVGIIIYFFFSTYNSISSYLIFSSVSINLLFANYLVYRGLKQPNAFDGIKTPEKYAGSKISSEESKIIVDKLKSFMVLKKPYLNPNLTIKDLSEEFKIHHKFLSQIINSEIGKNFYDFVNYYRIQEAVSLMTKKSDDKMTILEILYEVGFNSKSTFNNAFKKHIGKTPSEFKRTA